MLSSIPLNVFGKGQFEEMMKFNAYFVQSRINWLIRYFAEIGVESEGMCVVIRTFCNAYTVRIDTCTSTWCCVCLCLCCDVLKTVRVR